MLDAEPSFVAVAGRRLAYDAVSPPDPQGTILLLPGAESNRLSWYKQLDVFGRAFRTFAVDYRDTGDSDAVSAPYRIADLADDAADMLSALAVTRAHVVGASLGGYVALQMALRHPDRVAKLVLVSTSAAYIPPSAELQEALAQIAQRAPTPSDTQDRQALQEDQEGSEVMQRLLATVTAPGYFASHPDDWKMVADWVRYRPMRQEAQVRQLQASLTFNVSDHLQHIQAPTLVIHGELDPRVAPEHGRYLAQQITGARLLLYPNTGHLVPIERAEAFNRDVLAFLQE
jgi:3-oxoadipate enol-lactonase